TNVIMRKIRNPTFPEVRERKRPFWTARCGALDNDVRRLAMHLSFWGTLAQISPGTECDSLIKLGLLRVRKMEWEADLEPTDRLVALFDRMPDLERLFPLLVEVVLYYKYRSYPGFVDLRAVERQLLSIGMTEDGLASLLALVNGAVGRRAI